MSQRRRRSTRLIPKLSYASQMDLARRFLDGTLTDEDRHKFTSFIDKYPLVQDKINNFEGNDYYVKAHANDDSGEIEELLIFNKEKYIAMYLLGRAPSGEEYDDVYDACVHIHIHQQQLYKSNEVLTIYNLASLLYHSESDDPCRFSAGGQRHPGSAYLRFAIQVAKDDAIARNKSPAVMKLTDGARVYQLQNEKFSQRFYAEHWLFPDLPLSVITYFSTKGSSFYETFGFMAQSRVSYRSIEHYEHRNATSAREMAYAREVLKHATLANFEDPRWEWYYNAADRFVVVMRFINAFNAFVQKYNIYTRGLIIPEHNDVNYLKLCYDVIYATCGEYNIAYHKDPKNVGFYNTYTKFLPVRRKLLKILKLILSISSAVPSELYINIISADSI